ncbi:hypothetical protein SSE37_20262 [Sagittula stellata E-37]|uniref:TIGR02300 family protein n=3 Tax=Rhodobacterales TaxID=204455 RepID=A3JXZ0_SAGS3|nr:hypothetical protein SSE37_20262 [Sagittula stellata E-37]
MTPSPKSFDIEPVIWQGAQIVDGAAQGPSIKRGIPMPKEEWGTKRVCPTTGKRFYDLNRNPIVSPYTGEVVNIDTGKRSMIAADAEDQASKAKKKDSEDVDLLDDDDVEVDLDDDDVLEDEDDDNVSLDDITDVSNEDDDS